MSFRLPDTSHRVCVIGRTGTGKSVFGLWLLSKAPFNSIPYIVVDYKGEQLVSEIDRIQEIGLKSIPKHPGLYVVRPRPNEEKEVEEFLERVWARERVGLFLDEMVQLPRPYQPGAVRNIFVQGRSKRIPVIGCTQRPSGVSPYLFSESDFFAVFGRFNKRADTDTVAEFTPWSVKQYQTEALPRHWCRWYDVADDFATLVKPAPDPDDILQVFDDRLRPARRAI